MKYDTGKIASELGALSGNSRLARKADESRRVAGEGEGLRRLTAREISALESRGNFCGDWNSILVSDNFIPEFVRGSSFSGPCVLGRFSGNAVTVDSGAQFPSGIYNSVIIGSRIGDECLVAHAGGVSNYILESGSVIFRVNALSSSGKTTFGNGAMIRVGNEQGRREMPLIAEMEYTAAAAIIMNRTDADFVSSWKKSAGEYMERLGECRGLVEQGAVIRNSGTVRDSFIGEGAIIDGATLVEESTLLSSREEPVSVLSGAVVKKSCLQWGCVVSDMALVESSLLTDHSGAMRHGKVTSSVLGPNTEISEGEVTSSLAGPFTGFHHQSLLIAALWPEGKGNVGYGANVGSNHTGKAPDQEIRCGEGVFFGLASSIKFPANFQESPYSVIATAVSASPQRVAFPFSLINSPSHSDGGIPMSHNEISPGWVLAAAAYMVQRNRIKFTKRNHSKRMRIEAEPLRVHIIRMMVRAREALMAASGKEFYTEKDIDGLGANYMTERGRKSGIETYTFYIHHFIQRSLWERLKADAGKEPLKRDRIYGSVSGDPAWEEARLMLMTEKLDSLSISENSFLRRQVRDNSKKHREVKGEDDARGRATIDDYDAVSILARMTPA
jgi:hypothetical protein